MAATAGAASDPITTDIPMSTEWPSDDESEFEYEDDVGVTADPDEAQDIGGPPLLQHAPSYTIDDERTLTARLEKMIESVADTLCLGFDDAYLLLVSHRYDAERTMAAYTDSPETVVAAAGLTIEPGAFCTGVDSGDAMPRPPDGDGDEFECPICMNTRRYTGADALPCGHWFCDSCWREHAHGQLQQGPTAVVLSSCMACPERMRKRLWNKYLPEKDLEKLSARQSEHFLDQTSATRTCPGVGCRRLATYPKRAVREIQCDCGTQWCFGCGNEWHSPATCREMRTWLSTSGRHSADLQWILANSKPCPRCNRPIEKNEGCKHMTCGKGGTPGCGHEFCWDCMQQWSGHTDFYTCDKPKPQHIKDHEAAAARAKAQLPRLTGFAKRYEEHDNAQRDALSEHMPVALACVAELEIAAIALPRHADTTKQAWHIEIRARRALKYSYVWAFLNADNADLKGTLSELEFRQKQLEECVTQLSEVLRAPRPAQLFAKHQTGAVPTAYLRGEWEEFMGRLEQSAEATRLHARVFASVADMVETVARRRVAEAEAKADAAAGAGAGVATAAAAAASGSAEPALPADPVEAKRLATERLSELVAELETKRAALRRLSEAIEAEFASNP